MFCDDAQVIIREVHSVNNDKYPYGSFYIYLAAQHLAACDDCEAWFYENVCPQMEYLNEKEEWSDDEVMMSLSHRDIHKILPLACPFKSVQDSE